MSIKTHPSTNILLLNIYWITKSKFEILLSLGHCNNYLTKMKQQLTTTNVNLQQNMHLLTLKVTITHTSFDLVYIYPGLYPNSVDILPSDTKHIITLDPG